MIDDREDAEQAALNARLQRLDAALRKVEEEKAAQETPPPARKGFTHAMRVGLNAVSEFIGAVLLGGVDQRLYGDSRRVEALLRLRGRADRRPIRRAHYRPQADARRSRRDY